MDKNITIDPGHQYSLGSVDGEHTQILRFAKRCCDPKDPDAFPGNTNSYPGTTIQLVVEALIDRLHYLQWQHWWVLNAVAIGLLRTANWLLNLRVMEQTAVGDGNSLSK